MKTHSVPPVSTRDVGGVINYLTGTLTLILHSLEAKHTIRPSAWAPAWSCLGPQLMMCMSRALAAVQILGTSPDPRLAVLRGNSFSVAGPIGSGETGTVRSLSVSAGHLTSPFSLLNVPCSCMSLIVLPRQNPGLPHGTFSPKS